MRSVEGFVRWARETGWRHAVGIVMVAFAIFPLVYVLSASLAPRGTLTDSSRLFTRVSPDNYLALFTTEGLLYPTWVLNTVVIATVSSTLSIVISAMAAYAFSRMRFRWRRQGLLALLLVQMFPRILGVVAIFLLLKAIGDAFPAIGLGTSSGLILVYLGGSLGLTTWIMTGNFNAIPRELDEAARIDGAGHARIFLTIILPLAVPMLAVLWLLSILATVGEFGIANILLVEPEQKTLALGLAGLVSGPDGRNANWGLFAAGSVLAALPVLVLFFVLQRWIVSGLTSGSVK